MTTGCRHIYTLFHGYFFIPEANQVSVASGGVLPSGVNVSCSMVDAQLFPQPQFVPRREQFETSVVTMATG